MKSLETNDWIILNNIIYKIYTTEDFDEMRTELLEQLRDVLAQDPRPHYHADPLRVYGMTFAGIDVHFRVEGQTLFVMP